MADLARIKSNVKKMADMGAPEEDIDGYIASEGVTLDDVRNFTLPTTPSEPGFIDRTKADLLKRNEEMNVLNAEKAAGKRGALATGYKGAGVGARAIQDVVGNAVIPPIKATYNALPESVTGPVNETAAKLGNAVVNNPYVQAGIQGATDLAKKYPETAGYLKDTLDIGGILSPKALLKPTPQGITGDVGEGLIKMGNKQAAKQTAKFSEKLVAPKETPSVKEANVGRTTEGGIFKSKKTALDTRSQEAAAEVAKVKGVGKGKTLQGNYNVIQKEVRKEADDLIDKLDKNDVNLAANDYRDALKNVQNKLDADINITGDSTETANKILTKYAQIIQSRPKTAANLLRARRELDSWIKSQKGQKAFSPDKENAISSAVRIIRQESNDLIDRKVANVDVSGSLRKQKNLLNAMENIAPKAAEEGNNAIIRLGQRIAKGTGLKSKLGQAVALGGGTAAAGALTTMAPAAAGLGAAGYLTYKAGKMVLSPTAKKAIGTILKKSDDLLRTTNDVEAIKLIKKDRALVLDMLHNLEEQEASGEAKK